MSSEAIDLDEFRKEARAWLAANLKRRRYSGPQAARTETKTPEEIAASRVLQRKLFDAGYAGISFPKEYGGRGFIAAHEALFREEAAGDVMPDFGAAGGVYVFSISPSLLAHPSPRLLRH